MKISYERRKSLYGYGFISVWLIGTVLWFLKPLAESLCYCFMDNKQLRPEVGGMQKAWLPLSGWQWLENFRFAFAGDREFKRLCPRDLFFAGHHRDRSCLQHHQRQYFRDRCRQRRAVFHAV